MHDSQHHVAFTHDIRNVQMTGMRASVNDPVHIQVQMIKLGQKRRVRHDLIDLGVTFTDPAIKLKKRKEQS